MRKKPMLRALGFGAAMLATAAQAQAPTVGYLNTAGPACFSRDYDAAHLRANPNQRVTGMALIYVPTMTFGGVRQTMWDLQANDPNFNATLAVKLRGQRQTHYAGVNCRGGEAAGVVRCVIDEDGGAFTMTWPDAGLQITNENGFRVAPNSRSERGQVRIEPDAANRIFILAGGGGQACGRGWSLPR